MPPKKEGHTLPLLLRARALGAGPARARGLAERAAAMPEKYPLPLPQLSPARQVDITGDGGVLKEVLETGAGELVPQPDDDVCVHYVRWLREDWVELDRCSAHACRASKRVRPARASILFSCSPRRGAVGAEWCSSRNAPLISLGGAGPAISLTNSGTSSSTSPFTTSSGRAPRAVSSAGAAT